jgi:hypothetical protein
MSEKNIELWLINGLMVYLCAAEGNIHGVNIDDPSPDSVAEHGTPNEGIHTIFRADMHDPGFDVTLAKRHVAMDGNQVLVRAFAGETEKRLRRRGRGRPRTRRGAIAKSQRGKLRTSISKVATGGPSRCNRDGNPDRRICAYVKSHEKRKTSATSTKTEGVFATMDMRTGEILHMAEMLNAECTMYKVEAMKCVNGVCKVGVLCNDCACQLQSFVGKYCTRVVLDGLKYIKHLQYTLDRVHRCICNSWIHFET